MIGVLDLLRMIPQDNIEDFCIPYVRSVIEDGLSKEEIEKWDLFWEYFTKTWISILDSWNICLKDGSYKDLMNRTNNGLEHYNCRFNDLFEGHNPSLIQFVQIVEEESCYHARQMEDIRMGREEEPTYEKVIIPKNPKAYRAFKREAMASA